MSELNYFAPGKLVLCGEYAVLAPEGEGLVAAVSAGVSARLRPSSHFSVSSPLLAGGPGELAWDGQTLTPVAPLEEELEHRFRFLRAGLEDLFTFLTTNQVPLRPFELEVAPGGDPLGPRPVPEAKLGLGTSAAVITAALAAGLAHHDIDPNGPPGRDLLFRLAWNAHRRAQNGHGSGIDVAASVYGGVVWFRAGTGLPRVAPVSWPEQLRILVGWSGHGVATEPRAAVVEAFRRENERWFEQFVASSRGWTRAIIAAIREEEPAGVLRALAMHRRLLLDLGERTGLLMEDAAMQELARAGGRYGVAKQSGAGGGDSGILVLRSPTFLRDAGAALRNCGLIQLALEVPSAGVRPIVRSRGAFAQPL